MALAAAAGLSGRRLLGLAAGAFAATAIADDVSGGTRWFRRAFLPWRTTTNVVAELGDPDAERTVLFVAHHDAAHSGLVFHPELPRWLGRRFPRLWRRFETSPPLMWGAVAGPALVALGAVAGVRALRLAGVALSVGYGAAMVDIGARGVVPGANDNLTAVAVLLSLAHALRDEAPRGVRVILLSTGAEESHQEGMRGFARRHFPALDPARTHVVCLDTVGSPYLHVLEGEGMLRMREYPKDFLRLVKSCADELGVWVYPNLRFRNATDGLVALKAGYPTAMIGSVDEFKVPTQYHWPTDTADRVDYGSVDDAARICRAIVRRLAAA